ERHAACQSGTLFLSPKTSGGELPPSRLQWRRLGGWSAVFPYNLEISRLDARTDITSLDGRHLCAEAEAHRAEALPVRVDAGAAVSLQSGVRGLRQNSLSTTHSEEGIDARGVFQGGGRVRDADGFDSGRRAADAHADRQDCRRPRRAQEIHLSVHQRAALEGKSRFIQTQQISDVFRAYGWAARAPRL